MSFLAPLFLIGAAAAAVPVILHLLGREPEARVRFAVVRLLRIAPVEPTDRRRLRELLLLALRVAALLLLALAFARPFFPLNTALGSSGVSVVALDSSLSLSAPGRFDRAKALAREAIGRIPAGDRVALVTFADDAHVAAPPSVDRGPALAAVAAAATTFGRTRYRAALNRAAALLEGRRGSIVVITDLQESGWDLGDSAAVPESARVEVMDVGPLPPNLAVTAVRVADDRVVATIRSAGADITATREAHVRLIVDNRPAGEGAVSIGPDRSADVTLPGAPGLAASVMVDDPDGVQGDNVRYFVLDPAARPAILVVTADGDLSRDALYVGHALAAEGREGTAWRITAAGGAQVSSWDRARLGDYAAVVLLSTRGLDRSGRALLAEYARGGGGVLIAAGPLVDGEVAADVFSGVFTLADSEKSDARTGIGRRLAPADARHPLFQAFGPNVASLGLVTFERIAALRGPACHTLARFTTGEAALVECPAGAGRTIVLASDLNRQWNDFPRHATFVPFVHETVRYLTGGRRRAAEYLIGQAPVGIAPKPGIHLMPGPEGGAPSRVAVNVDPAEANPARLTPDEFLNSVAHLQDVAESQRLIEGRQQEDRQQLWWYALVLMVAVMLVESFVGARIA